ncbi:MAG TPA: formylmethanofuran dehydrogenase subunit B, partial [Methanosarcina sp.]|nr:formylmethanofuran dehydrogenase subunit B [Methanosarcina sp.]
SDIVLPGVIDAMECDGTFYRLDDVPVHFDSFTSSPFEFTKSNEDTLKQLFEKIRKKRDKAISLPYINKEEEKPIPESLP